MAIFRPIPSQIFFFGLVPKSPVHIGLIYVKTPKPNISCLGPFKWITSAKSIFLLVQSSVMYNSQFNTQYVPVRATLFMVEGENMQQLVDDCRLNKHLLMVVTL